MSVAILLYACSSLKHTGKSVDSDIVSNGFKESEIIDLNITNNDFSIEKAEVIIIQEGRKQEFFISLKYKCEGIYLLSIRSKTGIEIERIFLDKDSIMINERIKKKLYYASSDYLLNKYGISVSALPLIFGDFIQNEETDSLFLTCKKGRGLAEGSILNRKVIYTIDCGYKKINNAQIRNEYDEENIVFFFNKFEKQNSLIFAKQIEIKNLLRNIVIRITIYKIKFEDINEIDFVPGRSYEKVLLK